MQARFKFLTEYLIYLPCLQSCLGLISGILIRRFIVYTLDLKNIIYILVFADVLVIILFVANARQWTALVVISSFFLLGVLRFDSIYSVKRINEVKANYGHSIETVYIKSTPKIGKTKITYRTQSKGISGDILLTTPRAQILNYGDVVKVNCVISEPEVLEEFDYKFYLNTQGIFYTCRPYDFAKISHTRSINSVIAGAKVSTKQRLQCVLPNDHVNLVTGLLWGESNGFSEEFETNLSRTGTTHIVAVSGFNVSIVVMTVMRLAGFLDRKTVVKAAIMLLFFYLIIVGLNNLPAMRAGVMGFVTLFSRNMGRKTSFLSLVSIAVIILALMNPLSIFTVSFQLSFFALIGIVGFSKTVERAISKFTDFLAADAATTISAIVSTSPITLVNFHTFSVFALFVNLLILPLIPLLTLLAIIELILSWCSIGLGRLFALCIMPPIDLLMGIINTFGNMKMSSINLAFFNTVVGICMYALLLLVLAEISFHQKINARLSI